MFAALRTVLLFLAASSLMTTVVSGDDAGTPYGEVDLTRDRWGVPHIEADSDAGALYGLGYAAAEDRGYQMHYFLRIVQGRMSEVFGLVDKNRSSAAGQNNTLEHDRVMRAFGFASAADEVVANLDPETLELLEAYSAGVNAFFAAHEGREHYLFEKTGLRREPWRPADCVLSWWHFGQFFAKNGLRDRPSLAAAALTRGRGAPVLVDDDAAVVRREDVTDQWVAKVDAWVEEMGLDARQPQGRADPDPKFSHAWVIGGKKTTTGSAVLVSDPQTPVWNPSMLYEFHAQGATFNARGVGVAGSPIILIGFNQHVAWGVTALGADQADLFILHTDAEHPNQYQVDGQWLDFESREEVIGIRDAESETMTIRETIFGPVVSDFVWQNPPGQEVALCRVPMAEPDRETIQGALGMMRARSCDEFAAALPLWRFPTANCVFGDRDGNIGYWSLGALPVRSALTGSDGGHAQDGSTRDGMWRGMIPYELLPHCMNPQRGYLVSANHRTIQSFYRVPFGNMTGSAGDTDRGLRIKERILEHLDKKDQFEPDDVLAIHFDSVNVWKREIVRLGLKVLRTGDGRLSANSRQALQHLRDWYQAGARTDMSIPGTELVNEMNVIFRGGAVDLAMKYGGGVSGLARFAKTVRARDAANPNAAVPDDEVEFVDLVLDQAWRRAQGKYGADPDSWHALAIAALCHQRMAYMQSLDGFPGLDERYDINVPLLSTIDGATVLSQRAQSYTQYVPLHDTDQALSILPIGSSDNPVSVYRFSTYGQWSQGQLHPAPLSREAVGKLAVARETLGRKPRRLAQPPRRGAGRLPQRNVRGGDPVSGQPVERRPLPGKKPDDPTLEAAIRYLNRPERTDAEVQRKLVELRDYVRGNESLRAELLAGFELFTHLMRESQAGRLPIQYGSPATLKRVQAFYDEVKGSDK